MRIVARMFSNRLYVVCLTLLGALAAIAMVSPLPRAKRQSQEEIDKEVEALLAKMTLEEKIELLGGEEDMFTRAMPQIGLPRLKMSDGPLGVRTWGPTTAYAAGIGLAASWDTALARKIGESLGRDARARGVDFLLGPGVNIYRAPMNGRNFEYFGEDPYLAGQIAAQYILGVQSEGVVATVKHYDANNSEYDRNNINTIIDERTLREIYLPAFEAAVKEGQVGAVMDSYNLVNGEHSTQNKFLNEEVLKKDWGFRGILMSDWGGTHDGIAAANAGLDLEMPSAQFMNQQALLPAIKKGQVSLATIDDKVRRILRIAVEFGFLNREQTELNVPLYNQESRVVALQSAEEGMVLLKNERDLLPLDLSQVHTIAIIGPDAFPAQPTAGGSAYVSAFAPVSFLTGISDALAPGVKVLWNSGLVRGRTIRGVGLLDPNARKLAALADVVIVSVGFNSETEGEGHDRTFSLPPGQEDLIKAVASANPHTIVVLTAGGSVATSGWLDRVPVLLQTWYSGSEAGEALAAVLVGRVAPSGKLPITWWRRVEDNPAYSNYYEAPGTPEVKYQEGVFLGYRAVGKSGKTPLFPFGFGLSYTTFAFRHLSVTPQEVRPQGPICISFDVQNTGQRAAAEVAEVYVSDPSATVPRPAKELKGFQRVELRPGETKRLGMKLNQRSLAYWDVNTHGWKVDPGQFVVYVGDSSEHVPLREELTVR